MGGVTLKEIMRRGDLQIKMQDQIVRMCRLSCATLCGKLKKKKNPER